MGQLHDMTFLGSLASVLFKHSEEGILITDDGGAIIRANPAACRILGYSEPELCDRLDGGAAGALQFSVRLDLERSGAVCGHLTCARPNGSRCSVQCRSVFVDEGSLGRWRVILFRDPRADGADVEAFVRPVIRA